MAATRLYFDVWPRVVPADTKSNITIRSFFGDLEEAGEYEIKCIPVEGGPVQTEKVTAFHGTLQVSFHFAGEGEHTLLVEEEGQRRRFTFSVYSLGKDLFVRRPFKGDMHMHSRHSDGKEAPAYVAGACRRIGLDFMALTDHGLYQPSLEAQAAYAEVEHDLRIFPGEEVHPPENPIHIINFGGRFSINDLFRYEPVRYREEVEALMQDLGEMPAGVDRYQYASSVWCFQKIREAGGLGIFCHPYWVWGNRYYINAALTEKLLNDVVFDALELIGGYHLFEAESNMLQVARYNEARAAGKQIPIVGVSDAHGCESGSLFGWYYTIVFAPDLELSSLIGSIKELYSVAVEALPGDEPPEQQARVYGPYRLVKYARYLLREVFPLHDELCAGEGRLMLQYAAAAGLDGEAAAASTAAAALTACKGQTDRFWAKIFGSE